jgi:hypothetical protein
MQDDLDARLGAHLGDAAAHQPGSDYQHSLDFHHLLPSLLRFERSPDGGWDPGRLRKEGPP